MNINVALKMLTEAADTGFTGNMNFELKNGYVVWSNTHTKRDEIEKTPFLFKDSPRLFDGVRSDSSRKGDNE